MFLIDNKNLDLKGFILYLLYIFCYLLVFEIMPIFVTLDYSYIEM